MNWIKKNKIKSLVLLVFIFLSAWFLFGEKQEELPYRVTGSELLEVKEKCKNLAIAKSEEWDRTRLALHTLRGYGYSEYKGYCYAEFIRTFWLNEHSEHIVLYNTTEEKEVNIRAWPEGANWYDYDFDRIILGKSKIIDFRAPW